MTLSPTTAPLLAQTTQSSGCSCASMGTSVAAAGGPADLSTILSSLSTALGGLEQALESIATLEPAGVTATPAATAATAPAVTAAATPSATAGGPAAATAPAASATAPTATTMPGMASTTASTPAAASGQHATSKHKHAKRMAGMQMSGGSNGVKDPGDFAKPMKMKMGDGKAMIEYPRTAPTDAAKAQQLATAVTQTFSHLTYAQTKPGTDPSGTHRRIPPALRQQFAKQYPGLPVPSSVVFDKPGGSAVGVLYVGSKTQKPNTPMGAAHKHVEANGSSGSYMSHVWFVPDHLQLAYGDVMSAGKAKRAALREKSQS